MTKKKSIECWCACIVGLCLVAVDAAPPPAPPSVPLTDYSVTARGLDLLEDMYNLARSALQGSVLDVGTGKGTLPLQLSKSGYPSPVVGVDPQIPSAMVKAFPDIFRQGLSSDLPAMFPGQKFDNVFSSYSIFNYELKNVPFLSQALDDIKQVMAPGGKLYVSVNSSSPELLAALQNHPDLTIAPSGQGSVITYNPQTPPPSVAAPAPAAPVAEPVAPPPAPNSTGPNASPPAPEPAPPSGGATKPPSLAVTRPYTCAAGSIATGFIGSFLGSWGGGALGSAVGPQSDVGPDGGRIGAAIGGYTGGLLAATGFVAWFAGGEAAVATVANPLTLVAAEGAYAGYLINEYSVATKAWSKAEDDYYATPILPGQKNYTSNSIPGVYNAGEEPGNSYFDHLNPLKWSFW